MEVGLAYPVRQVRKQPQPSFFVELAAPGKTEEMVVYRKASSSQPPPQAFDPKLVKRRRVMRSGKRSTQHLYRFPGNAHSPHAVFAPDLDDEPRDSGVDMHVLVRVDMVEREPGR